MEEVSLVLVWFTSWDRPQTGRNRKRMGICREHQYWVDSGRDQSVIPTTSPISNGEPNHRRRNARGAHYGLQWLVMFALLLVVCTKPAAIQRSFFLWSSWLSWIKQPAFKEHGKWGEKHYDKTKQSAVWIGEKYSSAHNQEKFKNVDPVWVHQHCQWMENCSLKELLTGCCERYNACEKKRLEDLSNELCNCGGENRCCCS